MHMPGFSLQENRDFMGSRSIAEVVRAGELKMYLSYCYCKCNLNCIIFNEDASRHDKFCATLIYRVYSACYDTISRRDFSKVKCLKIVQVLNKRPFSDLTNWS